MHLNRRTLLAGFALCAILNAAAFAASRTPFDPGAFQAARESGKPVVLQVTATWCGPCQRLKQAMSDLLGKPDFKDLVIFEADYDADQDELRRINALKLTTLIVYRDNAEVLRASGETRPERVEAVLRKAL